MTSHRLGNVTGFRRTRKSYISRYICYEFKDRKFLWKFAEFLPDYRFRLHVREDKYS
jgi:hypothetical protein